MYKKIEKFNQSAMYFKQILQIEEAVYADANQKYNDA